jgi:hypothetical protein
VEDLKDLTETIVEEKAENLRELIEELNDWKGNMNSRIKKTNKDIIKLSKKFHDVAVSFITREEKYNINKLELKKKTL